MSRLHLLYQMDDLLEKCKPCTRPYSKAPEIKCHGCSVYSQLRQIGNNLGGKKEMAKLTLEEYQELKASGLMDKEIAQKNEMSPQYLFQLKKKWFGGSNQPVAKNQTPKFATPSAEEMRQLINDLSNSHKEKDKQIQELTVKVQELENLNDACSDIENECNSLREELKQEQNAKQCAHQEYARVQSDLEIKDYELETLLNKHADIYASLIRLEKENRALKELVKIYISDVYKK